MIKEDMFILTILLVEYNPYDELAMPSETTTAPIYSVEQNKEFLEKTQGIRDLRAAGYNDLEILNAQDILEENDQLSLQSLNPNSYNTATIRAIKPEEEGGFRTNLAKATSFMQQGGAPTDFLSELTFIPSISRIFGDPDRGQYGAGRQVYETIKNDPNQLVNPMAYLPLADFATLYPIGLGAKKLGSGLVSKQFKQDFRRNLGEYKAARKNPAVTDEVIDAANKRNEAWWEAPETQRRISQAFGSEYQVMRPFYQFGEAMRRNIGGQGYKVSFPSLQSAKESLRSQFIPFKQSLEPVVPSMASGVSYRSPGFRGTRYGGSPIIDNPAYEALHKHNAARAMTGGQNFVTRGVNPARKAPVVFHEGAHGITSEGFHMLSPEQYDNLAARFREPFKTKDLRKTKDGKIIDYKVGSDLEKSGAMDGMNYYLDPQEIYARIQEIREFMKMKPGQRIDGYDLAMGLTNPSGSQFKEGLGWGVEAMLSTLKSTDGNGWNKLADLMNFLPAALPVGVGATIGSSTENKEDMKSYKKGGMYYKKGGFWNSKFGKGLHDFGLAALTSVTAPVESMLGTDFGVSDNFKTKAGRKIGKAVDQTGQITGQIGKQMLNTAVPGSAQVMDIAGSTLEATGVTTDPSMVGVNTTPPVNTAQNKFVNNNPASAGFAKHGTMNYKYKKGGMLKNADIEAEGGELVLTQGGKPEMLSGGIANKIGSNAFELTGKPHSQGGEKMVMPNGESVVVSKKYATEMKDVLKKIEKAKESAKSPDKFVRNASNREIQKTLCNSF